MVISHYDVAALHGAMKYEADHLLVDGYSIIYAWPSLRTTLRRSLERARDQLVTVLTRLQDATGIRVTAVFDNRHSSRLSAGEAPSTVDVIFTRKGMTADACIERFVARAAAPEQFLVVTNDNAEATLVRSLGGRVITAEELQEWLESETGTVSQDVARLRENSHQRFLRPNG